MKSSTVQELTQTLLALISILGIFAIAGVQLYRGEQIVIPDVFSLLVGAVVGTYFGRTLAINGARQAGVAAAQAAVVSAQQAP